MSRLYPQEPKAEQKHYIKYYKQEMLALPKDYFEEIKQITGNEIMQRTDILMSVLGQVQTLQNEIKVLKERLDEYETSSVVVEEVEELKMIPEEEAYERISEYVKANPGCRTSQIISGLGINPDLALQTLHRLEKEKKIKGKDIERV